MPLSPGPAAALLAGLGAAALLADHGLSSAAIALLLLAVCLRAPGRRRWPYLVGALSASISVFLVSPLVASVGSHSLWTGPTVPVLGPLDVTSEELATAAFQASRLAAVALAFSAYALLLDPDRLLAGARVARRSALTVALATRLLPTLERDAAGMLEALRGRGVAVAGVRGHARLVSPLLAGALERGLNLAEAMEARGFGRPGATRAPRPARRPLDLPALAAAAGLVAIGVVWL